MRIALIGYGKMGKAIEKIAIAKGHTISVIVGSNNAPLSALSKNNTDVAIEFTQPEAAFANIKYCIDAGIPVLSGTTGWLERKEELDTYCQNNNGTYFYASNFSIGVNIFFKMNTMVANMMSHHSDYKVSMDETHHIHKKDSPSGTAITLAEGIINNNPQLTQWKEDPTTEDSSTLPIHSFRKGEVPGTHSISYQSPVDNITLTHTAHSREGFAQGAVLVAQWLADKKGVLNMDNFLSL